MFCEKYGASISAYLRICTQCIHADKLHGLHGLQAAWRVYAPKSIQLDFRILLI